jgi:hypothetical protein
MLTKDFKEFLQLLNERKVKYLLVGGYAVILHGYPRYTGDIDIWIKPDSKNAKKIMKVLDDYGFGSLNLNLETFTQTDQIIQLGREPNRIDLITSVDGVTFEECYNQKVIFEVEQVPIQTISKEMLKKNKLTTGRHKDLDDVEHL